MNCVTDTKSKKKINEMNVNSLINMFDEVNQLEKTFEMARDQILTKGKKLTSTSS